MDGGVAIPPQGGESFCPQSGSFGVKPSVPPDLENSVSKLLPTNEHPIERAGRVILGLGLITIALVGPKTPWGFLGVVPLATGLLGSCPLYTVFGFSTCPAKAR
ncbi:MAG: DUF2892 domain-containing protein [Gemmatimonadales bacterium]